MVSGGGQRGHISGISGDGTGERGCGTTPGVRPRLGNSEGANETGAVSSLRSIQPQKSASKV